MFCFCVCSVCLLFHLTCFWMLFAGFTFGLVSREASRKPPPSFKILRHAHVFVPDVMSAGGARSFREANPGAGHHGAVAAPEGLGAAAPKPPIRHLSSG